MSTVPLGDAGSHVPGDNPPTDNTPDFSSMIPDSFQEKPYMKGIDSMEKLLNQFDNAQSLIGKKTIGIPSEESSDEEWQEFYSKMGRPEEPDKYEFNTEVELPEPLQRSEEQTAQLRKVFHEAGLTAKQANHILKANDQAMLEHFNSQKEQLEANEGQQTEEWNARMDKLFGNRRQEVEEIAEKMLKDYVPEGLEEDVKGLDNKSFMILTTILDQVHKNHIAEDSVDKGGEAGAFKNPAEKRAELVLEGQRLMMERGKLGYSAEGEQLQKKINEIFQVKIPALDKQLSKK